MEEAKKAAEASKKAKKGAFSKRGRPK